MADRPALLDLFCGEGGAAAGYKDAGFYVVGVDTAPLGKRYAGDEFIRADAMEFLAKHGREFQYKHASPPCQSYSIGTAGNPEARAKWPRLIPGVRELFQQQDGLWVIENVEQAKSQMIDSILLCGRMFGLGAVDEDGMELVLDRHRLFESNALLTPPMHPIHGSEQVAGVYSGAARVHRLPGETLAEVAPRDRDFARNVRKGGYVPRSKRVKQDLLGIDWMTVRGMEESIPPAYAEFVGGQLLSYGSEVWRVA